VVQAHRGNECDSKEYIADVQSKTGPPLSVLNVATDKVRQCCTPAADAHIMRIAEYSLAAGRNAALLWQRLIEASIASRDALETCG